jgi:hypothetical protein
MDFNEACLNLQLNTPFNLTDLKKQYRIMSLKYHPDKHVPDNDGFYCNKFRTINESYNHLCSYLECNDDTCSNESSYTSLYTDFLSSFFSKDSEQIQVLIKTIINAQSVYYYKSFENMDKSTAIQVFEFVNTYQHILHISSETVEKIKKIINNKVENDNMVILNPLLDDLLQDNIYILTFEEQIYYVPLWHDEIYYNHTNNNQLVVKCMPDLSDNISLDNNNNLIISVSYPMSQILNNSYIEYKLGKEYLHIPTRELYIRKIQKYTIKYKGISLIDHKDIYNNKRKSDIIFLINII